MAYKRIVVHERYGRRVPWIGSSSIQLLYLKENRRVIIRAYRKARYSKAKVWSMRSIFS
jgi:hypothetical protein